MRRNSKGIVSMERVSAELILQEEKGERDGYIFNI